MASFGTPFKRASMTNTENNLLLELQGISRLLHNLLLDYPSETTINYFIENQLDKEWPALSNSATNHQGKQLLRKFLSTWHADQINEVKLDYGQLFFGPGEPKAVPWGSVYLSEQQILNGDSTLELMRFYKKQGISFDLKYNQPVDHIALFYAVIDQLLEQIISANDSKAAKEALIILLQQHLLPWSGRCLALAQQHAQTDFYQGIVLLATDFETTLAKTMHVVPMPMRLFR